VTEAKASELQQHSVVFFKNNGKQHYIWRFADQDGRVADVFLQARRVGAGTLAPVEFSSRWLPSHCHRLELKNMRLPNQLFEYPKNHTFHGVTAKNTCPISSTISKFKPF